MQHVTSNGDVYPRCMWVPSYDPSIIYRYEGEIDSLKLPTTSKNCIGGIAVGDRFTFASHVYVCTAKREYFATFMPEAVKNEKESKYAWRLSHPWFDEVKSRRKQWEGRRLFGQAARIRAGDRITFHHATDLLADHFSKQVVCVRKYASFRVALQEFNERKQMHTVLPGIDSIDAGVKIYEQFVSTATQSRDGVVMIELADV